MQGDGDGLTQTQPFLPEPQAVHTEILENQQGVYANLAILVPAEKATALFALQRECREVFIGRHPDCLVQVQDKRVSAKHVRIHRDDQFRYFLQELSANGCYVNNDRMNKGDTRALQHLDQISLCVPPWVDKSNTDEDKMPFAVFVFRLAGQLSDSGARRGGSDTMAAEAKLGAGQAQAGQAQAGQAQAGPSLASPAALACGGKNYVSEQWFRENWDIKLSLGQGNFSEVRLGVQVHTGNRRAVKVIDKRKFLQFQSKRESHLSLSSEAEVLTSLDHPGIVRFYEWYQTDASLYLVMELMEGGDLLQCILEEGCFAESQARRLFRELCEAVDYLHQKDVVHRDLKPENILLPTKDRDTMHPKIADFGLARKNVQARDCRTFCGTPHYFAPEVINTFRERQETGTTGGYGKQADMWSLGVILYILLSGIPPFEEESLYEQITEGKYEFDVSEWRQVSPAAKDLVKKLMTVNPNERLTIQQALSHRWLVFRDEPSPEVTRPPPVGEPAAKRVRTCGAEMSVTDAVMEPVDFSSRRHGAVGA